MDLRHAKLSSFSGFSTHEVEKMERLLKEHDQQSFNPDFCKKLARCFSRSKGRAGKAVVKWTEVQIWFQNQLAADDAESRAAEIAETFRAVREAFSINDRKSKGKKIPVEKFEAKSSVDGAWYDVSKFVENRNLDVQDTDVAEVLVRFSTFKKDDDEWINVKNALRERSITLKASECHLVEVGQTALYYEDTEAAARFFDIQITDIQRQKHNARGCSCEFTIRYIRDNYMKEKVPLMSLCFRPNILDS